MCLYPRQKETLSTELLWNPSVSYMLLPALTSSQDLHSKLEVTAKVLKDNQEASARELINQQAKLREVNCTQDRHNSNQLTERSDIERNGSAGYATWLCHLHLMPGQRLA